MKKLIMFFATIFIMVASVSAQSVNIENTVVEDVYNLGEWSITKFQKDELKGNEEYFAYMYRIPKIGSFIFWSNKEYQFRLVNEEGIFNYNSYYNRYTGSYRGMTITVGLYNEKSELIEKFDMYLSAPEGKPSILEAGNPKSMNRDIKQKTKVKKILNHLFTNNGYVRIIADTYGEKKNFDLIVNKIPWKMEKIK